VSSTVFRKVSLDRLASPEQLDQLMQVTDPKGWIILSSFGILLATAIGWGFLGRLPQDVTGVGMLVKSGGVFEVITPSSGRITDVAVRVGDMVTENQVVARMSQPELADRLAESKAVLVTLKAQHGEIVAHGSEDVALQTRHLHQQRTTVEQSIAAAEQSVTWLEEKIAIQEKLARDGLLTRQTLLNTREQRDGAQQRIGEGRAQLAQIAVQELDLRSRRQEDVRTSQIKIEAQERVIAELERTIKSHSEVVVQQTGRILEIIADQGALVDAGQPILTLDLMGRTIKDLEAIVYVPSKYGKQIKVGMPAFIAPSTVKREEYGLMMARITYVSDYPATSRGMVRVLKNDKLVTALAGNDAPYEVHADLVVDERTASQYRWSSSQGPPLKIQSGTVATAQITVAERRPIEMILPLMREYTGL
jgi:HlyD family secretion protein